MSATIAPPAPRGRRRPRKPAARRYCQCGGCALCQPLGGIPAKCANTIASDRHRDDCTRCGLEVVSR